MAVAELNRMRRSRSQMTRDHDEQIEWLQSRLLACVSVLEALVQTQKVDLGCHETIERVVRQARRRLLVD